MNLRELFDDVDVSEPSCKDKILMYLEELRTKDEEFMNNLVSKLDMMEITWDQPWYQESHYLTRRLKDTDTSESYRTDKFTKVESEHIEKNWKKFRKFYNVSDTPICLARYKSQLKGRMPKTAQERVRHFVTSFLAQGLQRTLAQVYKQFITMYGHVQVGTYSKLEEKVIQICLDHCPDKAGPILIYILGREPRQVYNKINSHIMGPEKKEYPKFGPWTLEKASKLVNLLRKETGLNLPDLKYKEINRDIWLKLQEEMQHPMAYIRNFWLRTLHVQVFVQEDLKYNKLRRHIFKKLKSHPYKVWNDIRWNILVKEFPDGCTPFFIHCIANKTLSNCKQYRELPLEVVIDYALNRISLTKRNWRIRRLILNDKGELQPVI